ncbi:nuclear transport factor 2 family protein [Pedobacter nototheniae]|uniref:nuclear transport factor 2 family protein n=1 Tax=Pedobacter nototheniae TaxID=2488994 RepID=UPI00103F0449|nr:nuclear transport factor 2 family protein [Pedobacter nototheniae]
METDLIIKVIDEAHKNINEALINKSAAAYLGYFDENLRYVEANGEILNKKQLGAEIDRYFNKTNKIDTTHYRIKFSFEEGTFTEKIARKSVIQVKKLLFFSKKQTIQTEEIYHWKNINGNWKIISVEIPLEEKY